MTDKPKRISQEQRILMLLEQMDSLGRAPGEPDWVPLPRLLSLRIASYTRRITDLRRKGHVILTRREWKDGQLQTAYRLVKP